MMRSLALVLSILVPVAALATPEHSPWPGGVGIVRIAGDERPSVTVDDQQALVLRAGTGWVAVVGIPLEQSVSGTMTATISVPGEAVRHVDIEIRANTYADQRLNVDRKYVEPSPAALERIFAERDIIDAALTHWREVPLDDVSLQAPVGGRRSSSFGLRAGGYWQAGSALSRRRQQVNGRRSGRSSRCRRWRFGRRPGRGIPGACRRGGQAVARGIRSLYCRAARAAGP